MCHRVKLLFAPARFTLLVLLCPCRRAMGPHYRADSFPHIPYTLHNQNSSHTPHSQLTVPLLLQNNPLPDHDARALRNRVRQDVRQHHLGRLH